MKANFKSAITAALVLGLASVSTAASAQKGMTWRLHKGVQTGDTPIVQNGMQLAAGWVVIGADNATDAYQGDTDTGKKLRILCIRKGDFPEPDGYQHSGDFYRAWSKGVLGVTEPVTGNSVPNRAAANEICQHDVGPGFRVVEHHDNGVGGWRLGARVLLGHYRYMQNKDHRLWASIKNQPANFWQGGQW